jgi:hypothetical protein
LWKRRCEEDTMKIADLYQSVTANIIKDLEAGTAPRTKPWKAGNTGGILPMNAATKRSYNGINIPILWHAQIANGYKTASWMTYKQASELGAQVRGGEKSTHVVFSKQLNVKDTETDEEKKIGMLKAYSVFNVAQIDALEPSDDMDQLDPGTRQDGVTAFYGLEPHHARHARGVVHQSRPPVRSHHLRTVRRRLRPNHANLAVHLIHPVPLPFLLRHPSTAQ